MDWLGYKKYWDDDGKRPARRIEARAARHNLELGGHPYGQHPDSAMFDIPPFKAEGTPLISENWQMDPRGTVDGHNLLRDGNLTRLLEVDDEVPLSPLFVKDLAGRIIYIGAGPEAKTVVEWDAYRASALDEEGMPQNPWVPLVTFPRHCVEVEGNMNGADLLEEVFLTKFRTLDMGRGYIGLPSGEDEESIRVQGFYALANLFPYKYRLDTFYVDGWRLPQTQMLYAREVPGNAGETAGEELMKAWTARSVGMSYENWLEGQGEGFANQLFGKGCTLIPTFEACNGINVVSREFILEDFWPGRMVMGLHEAVESRASDAPKNTILEVQEPGYVTARTIKPAKVVVSDGSGYVSPNAADPLPLVPNLHLPHTRTIANWQATWVPTHPEHFEVPHLWGWDLETGRFLQLNGPLWDPLHYYYDSVAQVYEAIREPLDDNRWLAKVPDTMRERFYPVVPRTGFDVVTFDALERRQSRQTAPQSAVSRVPSNAVSADIGYHPLPVEFEYELDPFWFPEFHPMNREHGPCPEELLPRVCPVIRPYVSVEAYVSAIPEQKDAPWLTDKTFLIEPTDEVMENYPFLIRYQQTEMDVGTLLQFAPLPFLADVGEELLNMPTQKIWLGQDEFDPLEEQAMGLYDAVWDYREAMLESLRFRHMVYQVTPTIYQLAYWFGATVTEMQVMFANWYNGEKEDAQLLESLEGARSGSQPVPSKSELLAKGKEPMRMPKTAVEEGTPDEK